MSPITAVRRHRVRQLQRCRWLYTLGDVVYGNNTNAGTATADATTLVMPITTAARPLRSRSRSTRLVLRQRSIARQTSPTTAIRRHLVQQQQQARWIECQCHGCLRQQH
jgi:hypothetical protein